jgi:hypothetical protein
MASVFTLEDAAPPRRARRSRKPKGLAGPPPEIDTCKCVYNPRNGTKTQLCFVGKSKKAPTGWKFRGGGCR